MYRWEPESELTNAESARLSNLQEEIDNAESDVLSSSQEEIDTANKDYLAMQRVEHALAKMIAAIDRKITEYLRKNTDTDILDEADINDMTIVVDSIKMIGGQKGDKNVAGTELYAQALKDFFITETYVQALKDFSTEEDSYSAMPRWMNRIEFEKGNFVQFPDIRFVDTQYLLFAEGEQSIDVCISVSSTGQLKFKKEVVNSVEEASPQPLLQQVGQLQIDQGTFRVTPANVIPSSDPGALILVNASHHRTISFKLFPPDETAKRILGIGKRTHSDSLEQQDVPMGDGPTAKKPRIEIENVVAPAVQAAPTNQ